MDCPKLIYDPKKLGLQTHRRLKGFGSGPDLFSMVEAQEFRR